MPKRVIDYSKCVIYKIQHLENEELLYVGHTTDFKHRKYAHKAACNSLTNSNHNLKVYQMMRENGGWVNFNMVVLHKYPCHSREEADKEEDKVMRELKANMNSNYAYFNKEKFQKEYFIKTREHQLEKAKIWYSENLEHSKQYYIENKEHISMSQKDYRDKNKERINTLSLKHREGLINKVMNKYEEIKHNKFTCGCGSVFIDRPSNHNNHSKSDKHKLYLKNQIK